MDRLKKLLRLIIDDRKLKDAWGEAGYSSFDEAREAIEISRSQLERRASTIELQRSRSKASLSV